MSRSRQCSTRSKTTSATSSTSPASGTSRATPAWLANTKVGPTASPVPARWRFPAAGTSSTTISSGIWTWPGTSRASTCRQELAGRARLPARRFSQLLRRRLRQRRQGRLARRRAPALRVRNHRQDQVGRGEHRRHQRRERAEARSRAFRQHARLRHEHVALSTPTTTYRLLPLCRPPSPGGALLRPADLHRGCDGRHHHRAGGSGQGDGQAERRSVREGLRADAGRRRRVQGRPGLFAGWRGRGGH